MIFLSATGHRPEKLAPNKEAYNLNAPVNIEIGKLMRRYILNKAGYDPATNTFKTDEKIVIITGMALGVDTVWAKVALRLKKQRPTKFCLECAIPCRSHGEKWNKASRDIYQSILDEADQVTIVSEGEYKPYMMQKRNEYMVNASEEVFAVWDGSKSGTGNCVNYALKKEKAVYLVEPSTLTGQYM